jgi:streptogramin lyase
MSFGNSPHHGGSFVWPRMIARGLAAVAACAIAVAGVRAADLSGRIAGVNDGRGVPAAEVTLTYGPDTQGPKAITVFTDDSGRFRFPADAAKPGPGSTLRASKLGYRQVTPAALDDDRTSVKLLIEPTDNIAASLPASGWLANLPPSTAKHVVMANCADCHQFPSPRVREYAAKIEAVRGGPEGDARALEEWRKVVRHQAWRTVISYMKSKHYSIFPDESPASLDSVDWETVQNDQYTFWNDRMGDLIAKYLAENFPHSTDSMTPDGYALGAPIGGTATTVIREFALPDTSLVREAIFVPGSTYIWGADTYKNQILRLNPDTGEQKWYHVPYKGSTGPHTIVGDSTGQIWISMVDHNQFARFDPKTEKWTLWTLQPSGLKSGNSMASAAVVHDISVDSTGQLARDASGKIWLTLLGTNQMATLDPKSGDVAFYAATQVPGLSAVNHMLYSVILSPDRRCAWFSQVNAGIGCLNTETKKVQFETAFAEGDGPRRMARDNAGNLWIPLFGSSQVAQYDTVRHKVVATFDLPDRAATPYAAAWDERRKALWVSGANADVIYRLNPATGKFTVYPLPRHMAFIRQISIDDKSGRLTSAYGNYPVGSGPSMAVVIDVGD